MTSIQELMIPTRLGTIRLVYVRKENLLREVSFVDPSQPSTESLSNQLCDLLPSLRLPEPATSFQKAIREAACAIPPGQTASYQELAEAAGHARSARAAGQVMARNPFCLFVPCHRVVPKSGGVGHYRWGAERKSALLDLEKEGRDAWEMLVPSE